MNSSRMIRVCKMGVVNYLDALKLQERLVSVRKAGDVPDTLLSLQHPPTYTLGKRRTDHNLLVSPYDLWKMGAELHYTERGGDITFHGPHQAVLYPIISLREIGLGPRRYVEKLESTMIELASLYGVKARLGGSLETGVWVGDRKIGAIGIHISGRVTSHGLAFNVDPDLNYFKHIVPCGIADKEVTSLRREVTSATTLDEDAVEDELISCFTKQLGYSDIVYKRRDSLLPTKPETKMNDQSHMLNPPPPMMMAAAAQPLPPVMMGQNPQLMAQPLQILTYSHWPQQQQQHNNSQPPGGNHNLKFHAPMDHAFGGSSKNPKQMHSLPVRNNWKGKKKTSVNLNDPRKDMRKGPNSMMTSGGMMGAAGYQPPNIGDLQYQNRLNSRKFYPKRKYSGRFTPYAPRNTSSFIMRAKKSGGIASLVSPCPVTPAVLPTPIFSPSREVLGDMAKEEWGVDGYGSMKGLIRLRNNEVDMNRENEEEEDDNEEEANGSSESDVEEEKDSVLSRLDHETSRFEMVYPNYGFDHNILLENWVDDQDTHIAQLEEENLILRERLFLMEREMEDLRRRLNFLERQNHVDEDANEEVVENESDEGSDFHPTGAGNRIADGHGDSEGKNDELMEGTSKAMLVEEKPVDEEKRYDGATVGISAEGNDGKNGEMQPEATSQKADAEMGEHENLEQ